MNFNDFQKTESTRNIEINSGLLRRDISTKISNTCLLHCNIRNIITSVNKISDQK